jgi:hypothetical protein
VRLNPELRVHERLDARPQQFHRSKSVTFRAYIKAANEVVSDIPGGPRGYQVIVAAIQHQADNQGALAQRLGSTGPS